MAHNDSDRTSSAKAQTMARKIARKDKYNGAFQTVTYVSHKAVI